jgi:uncharacterized protein YkwD
MRRRGRITGGAVVLVAVGSLGLAGCFAPPPPPPPPQVSSCPSAGDVTPNGTASVSNAIAQCHSNYKAYTVSSTLNASAQAEAQERAGMQCTSGALVHSPPAGVAENLYCWYNGSANCPSASFGAVKAVNGWLASAGHKANIDSHSVVGAGVICNAGHYFAVAHYQ